MESSVWFWTPIHLLLLAVISLQLHAVEAYFIASMPEQVDGFCVSTSQASDIKIICKSDQIIAIHEAYVTTANGGNRVCPFLTPDIHTSSQHQTVDHDQDEESGANWVSPYDAPCRDDIRMSLNKRCSGLSNCTFNLNEDHTVKCIGLGYVVARYICVPEAKFQKYCNLKLTSQFGYVATPGYPNYFPQLRNCSWNIIAGEGQTITINVLDVQMSEPKLTTLPGTYRLKPRKGFQCADSSFKVIEASNKLLNICGKNLSNLNQVKSDENKVLISFDAQTFSPTRGVLFRYSVQGCSTRNAPKNGHLMYRNESIAFYSCCKDHVFEDTHLLTRTLYCVHGMEWNATVSKCIPDSDAMVFIQSTDDGTEASSNVSLKEFFARQLAGEHVQQVDNTDVVSDIVVPAVLMSVLLAVNAVVVYIIVRLRQKQSRRRQAQSISMTRRATQV